MRAVEREFAAVAAAATEASGHDEVARHSLGRALEALFDFGERLRTEPQLLEAFLQSRKLPWNKVTEANPYNGLVRLAFPNISKASVSQYSSVLRLAHDTKPATMGFVEWLGHGGGIAGRYGEARLYYNPGAHEVREDARRHRLALARDNLDRMAMSSRVKLIGGRRFIDGYATALVRIADGQAVIVAVLEQNEQKLEPVLLEFGPPEKARQQALVARPLSRLHEAVGLVSALTGDEVQKNERLILVENAMDDGAPICRVSSVCAAHTFPFARVTVPHHAAGIGPNGRYLLDAAGARRFVRAFPGVDEWSIEGPDNGQGACHLNSARCSVPLRPLEPSDRAPPLRTAARPMRHSKHLTLTVDAMTGYLRWIEGVRGRVAKRNLSRRQARPMPERLGLIPVGSAVAVTVEEEPNHEVSLFRLHAGGKIAPERWLSVRDLEAVCRALEPRDIQADGSFVDVEVADAGVALRTPLGGGAVLEVLLPCVISRGMDYAQICEELEPDDGAVPRGGRRRRVRDVA
ncbi:hypothetical protein [Roseicella aerolata]|uniref:Uncharacterized protein n=1 Tax=Roseicella aerolata TaxID=2883479 RepID=A0A9X1L779_9PROT|nr:hypothetical protein [Roseicella aerolata]MCB4821244.1 hypothetical protein [Roseicella aerolata]